MPLNLDTKPHILNNNIYNLSVIWQFWREFYSEYFKLYWQLIRVGFTTDLFIEIIYNSFLYNNN